MNNKNTNSGNTNYDRIHGNSGNTSPSDSRNMNDTARTDNDRADDTLDNNS